MRIRAKSVTKTASTPKKSIESSALRVKATSLPLVGESVLHNGAVPTSPGEEDLFEALAMDPTEEPVVQVAAYEDPIQAILSEMEPMEPPEETAAMAEEPLLRTAPPVSESRKISRDPIVIMEPVEAVPPLSAPVPPLSPPIPVPTPPVVVPVPPPCAGRPYTVRRGDSFQLIARRFGISVRALMDANQALQPGRLMVGDVLCIPAEEVPVPTPLQPPVIPIPPPTVPCPTPPAPSQPGNTYRVTDGESITDILMRNNVSLNAFQAANPRLRMGYQRVGDLLRMPVPGFRGACAQGMPQEITEDVPLPALAQQYGISVGSLLRANGHLLPSDFRRGQVICVPRE